MQELINELNYIEELKESSRYENLFFTIDDKFSARIHPHCLTIVLKKLYFTIYYDDDDIIIFNSSDRIISFSVVCEDKNEYFQLSTIHDFCGITFESFQRIKDVCKYLIIRYEREST